MLPWLPSGQPRRREGRAVASPDSHAAALVAAYLHMLFDLREAMHAHDCAGAAYQNKRGLPLPEGTPRTHEETRLLLAYSNARMALDDVRHRVEDFERRHDRREVLAMAERAIGGPPVSRPRTPDGPGDGGGRG